MLSLIMPLLYIRTQNDYINKSMTQEVSEIGAAFGIHRKGRKGAKSAKGVISSSCIRLIPIHNNRINRIGQDEQDMTIFPHLRNTS